MFKRSLKPLSVSIVIAAMATSALAQIAQEPLLNKPNTVSPNLTLILDTSGSMGGKYIYQYGTLDSSGMGPQGPSDLTLAQYSPDVNRVYYDPRTRYLPRVNYDGTTITPNAPTAASSGAAGSTVVWRVYFRKSTVTAADTGASGEYYNPYPHNASLVVSGAPALTYPNEVTKTYLTTASTKFPKYLNRTDCVTPSASTATYCTPTEEAQNHSNWKKWYSTRGEMAKTGLGHAFQPIANNSIRLGYSTIKNLNNNSTLDRGVSLFGDAVGGVKDLYFTWLYGQTFGDGTPNLVAVNRVGKYYQRTDSDGPWATIPNAASTGITTVASPSGTGAAEPIADHASCRRSFSMLLTDGYWNGTQPDVGDADNFSINILAEPGIAGYAYTPVSPFKDNASNTNNTTVTKQTLADLAMYYWAKDARTDLANRVPKIDANGIDNPSFWQNVSFYAVTLGIDGSLPHDAATWANLKSGATPWPTPAANQPSTIDDTWHATVNGRGELLNANNASELTTGLKKMFATIAGTAQTLSGVAVSTTFLKSGTRKYKPEYIPGTWSGKLSAIALDATTGNDASPTVTYWQVESGAALVSPYDPISTIPAAASRNIVTWNGSAAVPFDAANTGLSTNMVNYLRGDPANELRKGGTYRNRDAILGDIVNSSPAFILDNVNMGYEKLLPSGSYGNYQQFVIDKATLPTRTEGVLFVGANDGMVHAFRNSNGAETFAFVPQAVISNLYKLADSPYTHQYYVDGPNIETDAYLGGAWKNILVGSTGAGAKAVYALDVTSPLTMNASKVMWEVNSSTAGFSELGHVLSDVQVGILETGDWVAIFGNGYSSASGVARLFVVNLSTGALLKDISTNVGGGNGLGGVRVVRDATERIIGAYAGDLKGNMWKFNLTGASSSNWTVGLSGNALYVATDTLGNVQPITATPAVLPHPNGGYVVTFGTGKFFETTDTVAPYKTQRLYGVWDAQAFGAASTPGGAYLTSSALAAQFVQQTISIVTVGTLDYYHVSANPVAWGNGLTGIRGWYIDLPNSGQRVTNPIERLAAGTFVLASTLSPVSAAAADACLLTGSGSGWVYIIDGVTGSGPTKPTLDTNNDGYIDASDALVSGYQDVVDGDPTAISIGTTNKGCIVTAQNTCKKFELVCGQVGMPACPAAAIPGLKSREWRQLFMR